MPRTARLYMQLSKDEDKIEEAAAQNGNTVADLSIRGARKLITKKRPEGGAPPKTKAPSTKAGVEPPEPQSGSPDLADMLRNTAPDEVV